LGFFLPVRAFFAFEREYAKIVQRNSPTSRANQTEFLDRRAESFNTVPSAVGCTDEAILPISPSSFIGSPHSSLDATNTPIGFTYIVLPEARFATRRHKYFPVGAEETHLAVVHHFFTALCW